MEKMWATSRNESTTPDMKVLWARSYVDQRQEGPRKRWIDDLEADLKICKGTDWKSRQGANNWSWDFIDFVRFMRLFGLREIFVSGLQRLLDTFSDSVWARGCFSAGCFCELLPPQAPSSAQKMSEKISNSIWSLLKSGISHDQLFTPSVAGHDYANSMTSNLSICV